MVIEWLEDIIREYLAWYAVDTVNVQGMLYPRELHDVAKHHLKSFTNWLERTGASPCDDCECKAAYVLQELRRGNFTEVPLPKEDNDD